MDPNNNINNNEIKLTKLASCAGCGAKVGAGTLSKMLKGFKTHEDPDLLVGYHTSDDACVYRIDDNTAIVQTTDFFPPIADDPFTFGRIAATNALSDVYAMGGEPKVALNILCITDKMDKETVHEILRGGYDKVYEAGAVIAGGHTISGSEPIYGLSVTGFVHPDKILTNSGAKAGDVLILTKPLGIGVITTAAKAGLVEKSLMDKVFEQMCTLNKAAHDVMINYPVNACTDVTGFALLGHSLELALGSGVTVNIVTADVPFHKEACEYADMGFIPAGAYRNREFAEARVTLQSRVERAMQDILYDPQTSGGLLISVPESSANALFKDLATVCPGAAVIGYVTEGNGGVVLR